jgi:hypothetical protein
MDGYINYPNPHFTVHNNTQCAQIQKHQKQNQRIIIVNNQNIGQILSQFINNQYPFASIQAQNDMWVDINLSSAQQNIGFVFIVQAILGMNYQPLSNAPVTFHC